MTDHALKDRSGPTTNEDRYVLAAETLWESAMRHSRDGWIGRPDAWVAEVKAMRAEIRATERERIAKLLRDEARRLDERGGLPILPATNTIRMVAETIRADAGRQAALSSAPPAKASAVVPETAPPGTKMGRDDAPPAKPSGARSFGGKSPCQVCYGEGWTIDSSPCSACGGSSMTHEIKGRRGSTVGPGERTMTNEFKSKLEAWEKARDAERLAEMHFGIVCQSLFGVLDRGGDHEDVAWFMARAREARAGARPSRAGVQGSVRCVSGGGSVRSDARLDRRSDQEKRP